MSSNRRNRYIDNCNQMVVGKPPRGLTPWGLYNNIKKGVFQVKKKNYFWYFSLCALFIIASVHGWDIFLRIAVSANSVVVLLDIWEQIKSKPNTGKKEYKS